MQAAARLHWQTAANDTAEPEPLDDFGFNLPIDYVMLTGRFFTLSNYQLMPKPGGLLAQDQAWLEDMLVYMRGYARAQYEAGQGGGKPSAADGDDVDMWNWQT